MAISSKHYRAGIILIIIGFFFLLDNFNILNISENIWKLWPLILIWWGFTKLRNRGKRLEEDTNFQLFSDTVLSSSSPYIRRSSAFGDIRIKAENSDFAGGSVSSIFGKVSLDLRNVSNITGYGQLDIHSVFGDIVIRIPENLKYQLNGNSVFGSLYVPGKQKLKNIEYESPNIEGLGEKLVLRISQVFGDIELIN